MRCEQGSKQAEKRRSRCDHLGFAGIVILFGLGVWQLDRKTWKENLIATLNARLGRRRKICPRARVGRSYVKMDEEFRRVAFPAEFLDGEEALVYTAGSPLRPDVKGPGYWVFAPARLAGGSIVLVNRGFVPADHKDPAMRAGGHTAWHRRYSRCLALAGDRAILSPRRTIPETISGSCVIPNSIATFKKWVTAAPFYIDQEEPMPSGGLPKPGKLEITFARQPSAIRHHLVRPRVRSCRCLPRWLARRVVRRN